MEQLGVDSRRSCLLLLEVADATGDIGIPAILGDALDVTHCNTVTAAAVLVHERHVLLHLAEPVLSGEHEGLPCEVLDVFPAIGLRDRLICIAKHLCIPCRHARDGGEVTRGHSSGGSVHCVRAWRGL
jgi:hypothetical protein